MPDEIKGDNGHKLFLGKLMLDIRKSSYSLGW